MQKLKRTEWVIGKPISSRREDREFKWRVESFSGVLVLEVFWNLELIKKKEASCVE